MAVGSGRPKAERALLGEEGRIIVDLAVVDLAVVPQRYLELSHFCSPELSH